MELSLQLSSEDFGYLAVLIRWKLLRTEARLPVLSPRGRASVDEEGFERAARPNSWFYREDTKLWEGSRLPKVTQPLKTNVFRLTLWFGDISVGV